MKALTRKLICSKSSIAAWSTITKFYPFTNLFRAPLRLLNSSRLSCAPFFIIGSGRSGNTLLRSVLMGSPAVAIPPETHATKRAIANYIKDRRKGWSHAVCKTIALYEAAGDFRETWETDLSETKERLLRIEEEEHGIDKIIDEIYCAYANTHFPSAIIWGDKTPNNTFGIRWIHHAFPKAKFIHIVRDGRDVTSSYLESGIGLYSTPPEAMRRWGESVIQVRDFFSRLNPKQRIEVRYEDLVSDLEPTAKKLSGFLGIEFHEGMMFPERISGKLGDTIRYQHHQNTKNAVNTKSIGKWRRSEKRLEIQSAARRYSALLQEYSYG